MIIGIGGDVVDIRRVESLLYRFGDRFVQRVFTEAEQSRSDCCTARGAAYAKRFAAKEACLKALGVGLCRSVSWRDVGVVNLPSGKPVLELVGGALSCLQALLPSECEAALHLSLADDYPVAQASVIIEARRVT